MSTSGARRVLRWIGVVALALVAVAGIGLAVAWSRVPRDHVEALTVGSLAVDPRAEGTYRAGPVTVGVDSTGVSVTGGGLTLWRSDPGRAFVVAGRGTVDYQEYRGYFWPDTQRSALLPDQQLASARTVADSVVLAGTLTGSDGPATWEVTITPDRTGGVVRAALDLRVAGQGGPDPSSVALVSGRGSGAGVHGFGEQYTDFDLSGRVLPLLVREQGVGRGEQPITALADLTNQGAGADETFTYAAWPSFVTDDLRGVTLDPDADASHAFGVADTTDPTSVSLESWSPRMRVVTFAGATPRELLAARAPGVARPALAEWAQSGAILGLQGGTDEVRAELATMRAAGAPVTSVWIQDWTGTRVTSFGDRLWWTWQLDRQRYPGWKQLVADLRAQGIRTTTYVNVWLVDATAKGDPTVRNLWAEARDRGFLVTHSDGRPYQMDQGGFAATLVDLTNPAARDWYADVIAEHVLADGVEGFMADFGEGAPFDGVYHEGSGALVHNRWPALWARTVADACARAGTPDCLVWFRAGALGQERDAALAWNGDQLVTFAEQDGLASALLGTFSAGVSGWPLVHSDVGGYTSVNAVVKDYVRSPELLARWGEYEAFGVVMRTHESNRPAANLQVFDTPQAATRFAAMARVHEALAGYRREVVDEATRTGVPAIRHAWVDYPGSAAAEVDTQFLLGDAVLVAPVLRAGADDVEVTFPPGTWRHLFTGEEHAGETVARVACADRDAGGIRPRGQPVGGAAGAGGAGGGRVAGGPVDGGAGRGGGRRDWWRWDWWRLGLVAVGWGSRLPARRRGSAEDEQETGEAQHQHARAGQQHLLGGGDHAALIDHLRRGTLPPHGEREQAQPQQARHCRRECADQAVLGRQCQHGTGDRQQRHPHARPRQRGPLPGQARIGGSRRTRRGPHQRVSTASPEASESTPMARATTGMELESTRPSLRRIARSRRNHRTTARRAVSAASRIHRLESTRWPADPWGSSVARASPTPSRPSDVVIQARNVRSLAIVNRGSGSSPTARTHWSNCRMPTSHERAPVERPTPPGRAPP